MTNQPRPLHVLMHEAHGWAMERTTSYSMSNLLLEIISAFENLPTTRTYYRALEDGRLWVEGRDPMEVIWRSALEEGIVFEKLEMLETSTGWRPWEPDYDQLAEGKLIAEQIQEEMGDA
jgi:hypothetical protein